MNCIKINYFLFFHRTSTNSVQIIIVKFIDLILNLLIIYLGSFGNLTVCYITKLYSVYYGFNFSSIIQIILDTACGNNIYRVGSGGHSEHF